MQKLPEDKSLHEFPVDHKGSGDWLLGDDGVMRVKHPEREKSEIKSEDATDNSSEESKS